MDKCNSYHTQNKKKYLYDIYSGNCIGWKDVTIGLCWGTKECEECSCGGDRSKCDFYPEIKLRAQNEKSVDSLEYKLTKAIELLKNNGYEVKKIDL